MMPLLEGLLLRSTAALMVQTIGAAVSNGGGTGCVLMSQLERGRGGISVR
jgi:hypothetical protein